MLLMLTACGQNVESVSNGGRLEDAAPPVAATERPLAVPEGAAGRGEAEIPPFVKAYFMHMFVEALYSTPGLELALKGPGECSRLVYGLPYRSFRRFLENSKAEAAFE
jgi:hypothetical protein